MSVSGPIADDYLSLFRLAVGRCFGTMWKNAVEAVNALDITDVHTCDALTVDSALIEAAVLARNGQVHLYPHSANPNLPSLRNPGLVQSVSAATRAGCEEWKFYHPSASVRLRPDTSLPRSVSPVRRSRFQPVTVVVLGTSIHRYLRPILPVQKYEMLVANAFKAFRDLAHTSRYQFVFKPKVARLGSDWLDTLVDDPFWIVSHDHVLSIDLPNPVFISIGFGSTALIEGTLRGAPGLLIPLAPDNDYLSLDHPIFGHHTVESATANLNRLASPLAYKRQAKRQLSQLSAELGADFVRGNARPGLVEGIIRRQGVRGSSSRAI